MRAKTKAEVDKAVDRAWDGTIGPVSEVLKAKDPGVYNLVRSAFNVGWVEGAKWGVTGAEAPEGE